MTLPTFAEFEATQRARGCDEVIVREWAADQVVGSHSHPFDADGLVVAGNFWLTVNDRTRELRAGDTFQLARGVVHDERYGPQGATFWVGRRRS